MPRYKWSNPNEWLLDKIQDLEIKEFLLPLLRQIDFAQILGYLSR